jgi:hypothetical protein
LVNLAIHRNLLAELLDCWSRCGCSPNEIQCRIVLDKVLYDLDRAIDLYALGTAENQEPEYRAVAYSYIVDAVLTPVISEGGANSTTRLPPIGSNLLEQRISDTLGEIRSFLFSPINPNHPLTEVLSSIKLALPGDPNKAKRETLEKLITQELQIQGDMESRWEDTVRTMASECIPISRQNGNGSVFGVIGQVILNAWNKAVGSGITRDKLRINTLTLFNLPRQFEDTEDTNSSSIADSLKTIADSLTTDTGDRPNETDDDDDDDDDD